MVVHLEMEVDEDAVPVHMKGDVVDAHLVPVGDGADALGHGLPLDLPRVGVDDDVGPGGDLLDAGFDLFGDGVGPLERQVAVDVDRHVHEKHRAGAADANLPDVEHAFDLLRGVPGVAAAGRPAPGRGGRRSSAGPAGS